MFGFLGGPCGCWSAASRSVYRSYYCGLCNRLRVDYGPAARFLVNRDATFLSLLAAARTPCVLPATQTTCCNPLGKARPVVQEGPGVSYAAAMTICGLQAKLEDDVEDASSRWRAMPARGAVRFLRRRTARAVRHLRTNGFPVDRMRSTLRRQPEVEEAARRDRNSCLDLASRPSEAALGAILAHAGDAYCKAWALVGRTLGRLIYTLDAVEDLERDARTGAFNPLRLQPALVHAIPMRVDVDLAAIRDAAASAPVRRHRALIQSILGPLLAHKAADVLSARGLAPAAFASMDQEQPSGEDDSATLEEDGEIPDGAEDGNRGPCCDCGACCEACCVADACCRVCTVCSVCSCC